MLLEPDADGYRCEVCLDAAASPHVSDLYSDPTSPAYVAKDAHVLIVGPGARQWQHVVNNRLVEPTTPPQDANVIFFSEYLHPAGCLTLLDLKYAKGQEANGYKNPAGVARYLTQISGLAAIVTPDWILGNALDENILQGRRFDAIIDHGTHSFAAKTPDLRQRLFTNYRNGLKEDGKALIFEGRTHYGQRQLRSVFGEELLAVFDNVTHFSINDSYLLSSRKLAHEYQRRLLDLECEPNDFAFIYPAREYTTLFVGTKRQRS